MKITKTQFIMLAATLIIIAILYNLGGAKPVSLVPPETFGMV